jgi:4'-phosphopantetheinyl transferase
MIRVYHTRFAARFSEETWARYSAEIPHKLLESMGRYRRWQDRQSKLLGKLLLVKCLEDLGYGSNALHDLAYNQYGRPFLDYPLDFNISHSGECVVCAVATEGKVGVDVEQIRMVPLEDFSTCFSAREWSEINGAPETRTKFFQMWTIKESVMKADGGGLSIPFMDVSIGEKCATLYGNIWYLRELVIYPDYVCYLSTDVADIQISMKELDF